MPRTRSEAMTTYVLLPAYNEEASLPPLLSRIKAAMEAGGLAYRVIVVNDGSADRTQEVAERHAASMPLTIVDHGRNRGLGEAMRSGFLTANELAGPDDVVVMMDADNTHPPELIPAMLEKVHQGYDLVVASRFAEGGRQIGLRAHRRLLSYCAGLLMRTLFPVPGLRDYSCGYRAYSAAMLQRALSVHGPALVEEQGFSCFVDVLLKLRRLNVRACEVPLVLRYDFKQGASKMRIARTIRRYFRLMARHLVAPGTRPFRRLVAPGERPRQRNLLAAAPGPKNGVNG
jgi:dolichol-phosphate mannosyltransferase